MKALAINGSPHKAGNTEILLREVLNPLDEADGKRNASKSGAERSKAVSLATSVLKTRINAAQSKTICSMTAWRRSWKRTPSSWGRRPIFRM